MDYSLLLTADFDSSECEQRLVLPKKHTHCFNADIFVITAHLLGLKNRALTNEHKAIGFLKKIFFKESCNTLLGLG